MEQSASFLLTQIWLYKMPLVHSMTVFWYILIWFFLFMLCLEKKGVTVEFALLLSYKKIFCQLINRILWEIIVSPGKPPFILHVSFILQNISAIFCCWILSNFIIYVIYSTEEFMNLLVEHINTPNPFGRKILLSWIKVMHNDPEVDMLSYLLNIIDGNYWLCLRFWIKAFFQLDY